MQMTRSEMYCTAQTHAEAVCGAQVTQRTVRDKFAVLSQMGTLLSLEGVARRSWTTGTAAPPGASPTRRSRRSWGSAPDFDPLEIASLDL